MSRATQHTLETYRTLAADAGLAFIADAIPNSIGDVCNDAWQCQRGHIFSTYYAHVRKRGGGACPACRAIDRYNQYGAEYGYTLVGDVPTHSTKEALWRCANGHEFRANHYVVRAADACPHCKQ